MHSIITEVFFGLLVFSSVTFGEYADGDYGQHDGDLGEDDRDGTQRSFGGGGFGGSPHAQVYGKWPSKGHPFGGPPASPFGGPPASPFGGPPASPFGAPPGSPFGGPSGSPFGAPPGSPFGGPPGSPFGGPPGSQHGGSPGSQHGGPPGSQHGVPPGSQHGVPPGSQHGGPPGSQHGVPPGSQHGGPPGSQHGVPPGSQHGGPSASPFGMPSASPFGGPSSSPLGAPPASAFGAPPGYQFGGPPGSQHGGPPGSQHGGPPQYQYDEEASHFFGGGSHGNSMNDLTDDEETVEGVDLPLVVNKVVNNVLLQLRPVLTQALTSQLVLCGLGTGNSFHHHPFPHPGILPGQPHHHFQNQHEQFQDLDEFLEYTDEDIDDQHFGFNNNPFGELFGGGMFGGQSNQQGMFPPQGMFGGQPHGMLERNAPKEPSEEEDDIDAENSIDSCTVSEGPAEGKDCIFPFFYNGKQHNTCVYNPQEGDAYPWCSTKVDDSGIHVAGKDEWGRCELTNDKCKTQT